MNNRINRMIQVQGPSTSIHTHNNEEGEKRERGRKKSMHLD